MTVFFTGDSHWDHVNIIKLCNRPFSSIEEMNEKLIENWNLVVKEEDEIWHLGDFCLGNQQQRAPYFASRLNGKKHFIWGNHDSCWTKEGKWWKSSQVYKELPVLFPNGKSVWFILFHYAMKVWNGSFGSRKIYQLYGHSHGGVPGNSRQCDVGVDCFNFTPVSAEQVIKHMEILPEKQKE